MFLPSAGQSANVQPCARSPSASRKPCAAPRGEFVLILGGAVETETSAEDTLAQGLALAKQLIQEGASTNQAAKEAAQATGLSKRTIYQALLADH